MKFPAAAVALAAFVTQASACATPAGIHHLAAAAIWTAAIAGDVVILAHHDRHHHSQTCGHYRRWYDGRWVYYYRARWEYYDARTGVWYYYTDAQY